MYLATCLISVQLFMVIIAGVATGEEVKTDADGKAIWYPTNIYLWYLPLVRGPGAALFRGVGPLGWRDYRDRLCGLWLSSPRRPREKHRASF